MGLLAGATGFLLWIWDWGMDAAQAWNTLYLRAIILAAAFLYPAALHFSSSRRLQVVAAFATTLVWLGAFFGILTRIRGGRPTGSVDSRSSR